MFLKGLHKRQKADLWRIASLLFFLVWGGCATAGTPSVDPDSESNARAETRAEVQTAIQSVLGAMSGQDVDEKKLREVGEQIRKDEESAQAVEAIIDNWEGRQVIKYCPVDGKRYSPDRSVCPEHGVPLQILEDE